MSGALPRGHQTWAESAFSRIVGYATAPRSSYAPIPEGVPPSDALMTSPILTGHAGGAGGAGGAAQFAQYGGVNPDLDPELAMVRCAGAQV